MARLLFDLDGTLIDSLPALQAATNDMLTRHGASPVDRATAQSFVGRGIDNLTRKALAHAGLDLPHETARAQVLEAYDRVGDDHTTLYPGALDALRTLATQHQMALCTNKPEGPARHVCKAFGLSEFFEIIVGGDSLPERKPHPAPALACLDRLEGDAPSIFIGDSEVDYETAQAAGLPFIFCTFGYLNQRPDPFTPSATIETLANLPDAIARLAGG